MPAAAALAPSAAQAACVADNWTGTTSSAWLTGTNWSTGAAQPTTDCVTIGVSTNNPVQITSAVSLNGGTVATGGSLTVGAGVGSTESLNIGTLGTLTMGTHTITLSGGTITSSGTGSVVSTGTIQGFGTFSAVEASSATWTANGTAGNALILDGGNTYKGTFNSSTAGGFDFGNGVGTPNSVTISSGNFSGSSGVYNLNNATISAGTDNNANAKFNVLGDSTVSGAFTGNNYYEFIIGGANPAHTLNLSSAAMTTTGGTGGPTAFSIGAGGVLKNLSGASSITGQTPFSMSGGRSPPAREPGCSRSSNRSVVTATFPGTWILAIRSRRANRGKL